MSPELLISDQAIERTKESGDTSDYTMVGDQSNSMRLGKCRWLPFVLKQLQAIASLPDGWDSHGAPSPAGRLVLSARSLIECLAQAPDLPQPHVNPTRNRGVQFEWESAHRYFELELVSEAVAAYFYSDEQEAVEKEGEVYPDGPLDSVLEYIRAVAEE